MGIHRKTLITGVAAILMSLVTLVAQSALARDFRITRVYDGDTVKAEGHDVEIKIRLMAIDAPEISRTKGAAS